MISPSNLRGIFSRLVHNSTAAAAGGSIRRSGKSTAAASYFVRMFASSSSNDGGSKNRSLANVSEMQAMLVNSQDSTTNPWKQAQDPQGSGQIYWYHPVSGESTPLGSPRPYHWVEVKDPSGSSLTYWWSPESNETTAIGAPKPPSLPMQQQQQQVVYGQPMTFGKILTHNLFMGFSMSLAFMMVFAIFR